MTIIRITTALTFCATLGLMPCAAIAKPPTADPLLYCQYENTSDCRGDFMPLCAAIEESSLNDRTRNGLITKVTDADAKVNQAKYEDAVGKLDDIDAKIHALDEAPKAKISVSDFVAIHSALEMARACSAL